MLHDAHALARPSLNASVVGHADSGPGGPGSIGVPRYQVVRLRPGTTHHKGDEVRSCLPSLSTARAPQTSLNRPTYVVADPAASISARFIRRCQRGYVRTFAKPQTAMSIVRINRNLLAVSSVRYQIHCFNFNVEICVAKLLFLRGVPKQCRRGNAEPSRRTSNLI